MHNSTQQRHLCDHGARRLGSSRRGTEWSWSAARGRSCRTRIIDVKKLGRIHGGAGKRITGVQRNAKRYRRDADGVDRRQLAWEYVHIA
jgi:hypothetical protein